MSSNNISNAIPIGTIVTSLFSENLFTGSTSTDWVLCDGRDISGSVYSNVTGNNNAPDFRGLFLRGKNNGRSDSFSDPDGERQLGSSQSHSTAKPNTNFTTTTNGNHSHYISHDSDELEGGSKNRIKGNDGNENVTTNTTGNHSHSITGGGDDETRPNNVCVNYFIKINYSDNKIDLN